MNAWMVIGILALGFSASVTAHGKRPLAPDDHAAPLITVQTLSGGAPRAWEGSHRLPVGYAPELAGGSVKATLNGMDVSNLFHPPIRQEGKDAKLTIDQVELPLQEGTNHLEIAVTPLGNDGRPDPEQTQFHTFNIEMAKRQPTQAQSTASVHKLPDRDSVEAFMRDLQRH